jgi:hypothetical protein
MNGLGKRINHAEAANIIGKHFPEVSDKLLNLLQLLESNESGVHGLELLNNKDNSDLLLAAIEQKTSLLRPVPFLNAIDITANRRYLKYALPPLVLLLVLLLAAPSVVINPSKRIVNYNTVYERPAPFNFVILNDTLSAMQGEDYTLVVSTEGDARPADVFITIDGHRYKMRSDGSEFTYLFKQLQRSHKFILDGGGVTSKEYILDVMPNPTVVSFRMLLSYPTYTGREVETIVNLGGAAVPEGTRVRWLFQTQDADSLYFEVDNGKWKVENSVDKNGSTEVSRVVMDNMDYVFCVSSRYIVKVIYDVTCSKCYDQGIHSMVTVVYTFLAETFLQFQGHCGLEYPFPTLVFPMSELFTSC